ncbi:hypothetical protein [Haloarchaeobius sp. DFWS5]|uniref:hypothetical protein n=1 Tax=Haloarchaeobius sp. DFWS5 TaxID=3446114 RepID=UPI003EBF70B1
MSGTNEVSDANRMGRLWLWEGEDAVWSCTVVIRELLLERSISDADRTTGTDKFGLNRE